MAFSIILAIDKQDVDAYRGGSLLHEACKLQQNGYPACPVVRAKDGPTLLLRIFLFVGAGSRVPMREKEDAVRIVGVKRRKNICKLEKLAVCIPNS